MCVCICASLSLSLSLSVCLSLCVRMCVRMCVYVCLLLYSCFKIFKKKKTGLLSDDHFTLEPTTIAGVSSAVLPLDTKYYTASLEFWLVDANARDLEFTEQTVAEVCAELGQACQALVLVADVAQVSGVVGVPLC